MADLYERLGVDRNAAKDEIRRAYKDLAREKHPDRGGDPEEFKKIQEAHEILSDEERRRMYDMTGSTSDNGDGGPMGGMDAGGFPFHFMNGAGPFGMPGVSFDMGNVFSHIFGGGGPNGGGGPSRRQRAPRGPNKQHDIGLTLSDFYRGKDIKLKFNQARRCGACDGSGAEKTEACGQCNASGFKTVTRAIGPGIMAQSRIQCDGCGGDGKRILKACEVCHGKKMAEREKQLDIHITPGMRDGQNLVFEGECSDSLEFDRPGDVVLTLRCTDCGTGNLDEYTWTGDDLTIRKSVSFAESLLGFSLTLDKHPGGSRSVVWNGGPLIHGAMLRLDGGGMPRKSEAGGGFGTLFIQIMVQPPPCVPWSPEDAAKLSSVFGCGVGGLANTEGTLLHLDSAESKLVADS
jgi:DnaJ-class molecular chaperone